MTSKLFLDSSFAIALVSARDQYHGRASVLLRQIKVQRIPLVTTRPVIVEVGNALAQRPFRAKAVALIESYDRDPSVEVAPLSDELYERSRRMYKQHMDKTWGLTDCISFIVMRERGLTDALTADRHFRQAGFRPLLG